MEFVAGGVPPGGSVALLPAAWNPPTHAHLALAHAARGWADGVALVMARRLPHKQYEGPAFETRLDWLVRVAAPRSLSVAISDGGLFIEMARACRLATGAGRVFLVCGRDAAERIVGWDYGPSDSIDRQLEEYELLVAPRNGPYLPPPRLAARIHTLDVGDGWHETSSTAIREREGAWLDQVPEEISALVAAAYS